MNDIIILFLIFVSGLILGIIFYGGLWFTVKQGITSQGAWWWFIISYYVRLSIVISGFYFIGQSDWRRFLTCFAGFVVVRIATKLWSSPRLFRM